MNVIKIVKNITGLGLKEALKTGMLEITDAMAESLKSLSESTNIELNIIK